MNHDNRILALLVMGLIGIGFFEVYTSLNKLETFLFVLVSLGFLSIALAILWEFKSKWGRESRKRVSFLRELPKNLLYSDSASICLGREEDLKTNIFLPDALRLRHIHILGATGSGKTESVILSFLRQDVERGLGSIILDAKGDFSFLTSLQKWVPKEKLSVFDLGSNESLSYDPLAAGSPLEAAQRLFSSLTWSEEYYKSKAFSVLQKLFERHFRTHNRNPRLIDLNQYLETPESFAAVTTSDTYPKKLADKEFVELSGLRDQIKTLCIGYLGNILSPEKGSQMCLEKATEGKVLYFRLQSLMSPQIVTTLGRLLINHLNFLAGTAHRSEESASSKNLIPVYFDEFASFACPDFADLISKARSAGFALHFSHQSVGDLTEVSAGFLNRITDNSGTKIVLRINDPDSADFFARTFGTKLFLKTTQRITNSKDVDTAEVVGEGTQHETHQFRAPPDLLKTLPTGVGSVLIAHGEPTPHGASSVFKIRFPRLL